MAKKKLKILYLAECISLRSKAGDLIHVLDFLGALVKKNQDVTVYVRGKNLPDSINKKIRSVYLPDLMFPFSLFLYILSAFFITFEILFRRPNIIYERDNGINMGVFVGRLFCIPVFLEINGDLRLEYSLNNKKLSELSSLPIKASYRLASTVIIPSRGQTSILRPLGVSNDNVIVVHNGVNSEIFFPRNKFECRTELGLDVHCSYFCFVGNLARWQGIEYAVLAFSSIVQQAQNVRFIIVGEGEAKEKLERMVRNLKICDKVIFLGSIDHNKVPDVINASDICIAPFTAWRNERIGVSPLKLYEYLSCGKPVITTSIIGTEIVTKLNSGFRVKPDSVQELKNAFELSLKMVPIWEKNALSLHEEIVRQHSWDHKVDEILGIMYEAVKIHSN